jgi:N-formylglutamate amidohydrolase
MRNCLLLPGLLFVAFLLSSQTASSKEMNELLREIRNIELTEIKCDEQRADYYRYVEGRIPILISAPHGAKHYRRVDGEGYWKKEDAYTSSLAIKLGQLTGAHVLYAKYKAEEDPNSDAVSGYKNFLRKAVTEHGIKFVIDLHGACGSQPFKVDVGTMNDTPEECSCPSYRRIIQGAFQGFEERTFNKYFTAGGCGTITSFARKDLGIEAAQIEINARYRIVESRSNPSLKAREQDVLDMVGRLERMIIDINESIGHERGNVEARKR